MARRVIAYDAAGADDAVGSAMCGSRVWNALSRRPGARSSQTVKELQARQRFTVPRLLRMTSAALHLRVAWSFAVHIITDRASALDFYNSSWATNPGVRGEPARARLMHLVFLVLVTAVRQGVRDFSSQRRS